MIMILKYKQRLTVLHHYPSVLELLVQVKRTILKWYCAVVYIIKYSTNTSNNVVFTSDGDRTRVFLIITVF